jgi:hypothetical protein
MSGAILGADDLRCEVDACNGHAMLPGGGILVIDGKRMCWDHAAKIKKQKDRCIRIPMAELQTALDMLNRGFREISEDPGYHIPVALEISRSILVELLEDKGLSDG